MQDYSKILWQAYEEFLLDLGGKKVPTPYRINIPPNEHPARQGKSSPEVILQQLKEDAKKEGLELSTASLEEIKQFMIKNNLGIDCSGFTYRILDHLIHNIKGKSLTDFGFPHVGRTNVKMLTSEEFTIPIEHLHDIRPGDLIKVRSSEKIPHCLIVLEVKPKQIIYAHSNEDKLYYGIHQNQIIITDPKNSIEKQGWKENYLIDDWRPDLGDGVKRLRVLL